MLHAVAMLAQQAGRVAGSILPRHCRAVLPPPAPARNGTAHERPTGGWAPACCVSMLPGIMEVSTATASPVTHTQAQDIYYLLRDIGPPPTQAAQP